MLYLKFIPTISPHSLSANDYYRAYKYTDQDSLPTSPIGSLEMQEPVSEYGTGNDNKRVLQVPHLYTDQAA